MKNIVFLYILIPFGAGCGIERQYEKYPDMIQRGTLTLAPANHPHGWGRKDCYACHVSTNIHIVDQGFGLDPAAMSKDPNACTGCHGNNGVSP